MTPQLLREIGEALYGRRWQSEMARQRGVSDRTVRRWDAGHQAIPDGIVDELIVDINARRDELAALLMRLTTRKPLPGTMPGTRPHKLTNAGPS